MTVLSWVIFYLKCVKFLFCQVYEFIKKNNKFVIFCYPSLSRSVKSMRMPFDSFAKVLRCPVYTDSYFGVNLKKCHS